MSAPRNNRDGWGLRAGMNGKDSLRDPASRDRVGLFGFLTQNYGGALNQQRPPPPAADPPTDRDPLIAFALRRVVGAGTLFMCLISLNACSESSATSSAQRTTTADLLEHGNQYLDPATTEPFSGPVYSVSPDQAQQLRMKGELLEGRLHGRVEIYSAGQTIWLDSEYWNGFECGTWRLNPFVVLSDDSTAWRSEVEARVPIPWQLRRELSTHPDRRSDADQQRIDAYRGGLNEDSLAWTNNPDDIARVIVYRTDDPECVGTPELRSAFK